MPPQPEVEETVRSPMSPAELPTLLVVDDDAAIRSSLRDVLEAEGYGVHTAGDGAAALALLRSLDGALPTLILLDLSMPVMDGWSFFAALRADQRLQRIPVVIITATRSLAAAPVAAGYMAKPIDLGRLLETVQRVHAAIV